MPYTKPQNTTDFMAAVADALKNRDVDHIEFLDNVSRDWLQTSGERRTQSALLVAAREAIDQIEEQYDEDWDIDPMGDHHGGNV